MSATGGMRSQDGVKMCLGGQILREFVKVIVDAAKDPEFSAQLTKGCTSKRERSASGEITFQQDCDQAAGAPISSHFSVSGTKDDFRQHTEMTMKGLGPNGGDTIESDARMTYQGVCPANLKPGQALRPDGQIIDMSAALAGPAKGN